MGAFWTHTSWAGDGTVSANKDLPLELFLFECLAQGHHSLYFVASHLSQHYFFRSDIPSDILKDAVMWHCFISAVSSDSCLPEINHIVSLTASYALRNVSGTIWTRDILGMSVCLIHHKASRRVITHGTSWGQNRNSGWWYNIPIGHTGNL